MGLRFARSAAVLALGACAGCGGGGGSGGGGAPIGITFDPATFAASFAQGDSFPPTSITTTLSGLPGQAIYLFLVVDQPVLDVGPVPVTPVGSLSFAASLHPSCTLAPGVHAGTIELRMCLDGACQSPVALTGNLLPYRFTVSPGHLVTAAAGGVAVPGFTSSCSSPAVVVKVGQLMELVSTLPVSWSTEILTSAGVPVVSGGSSTATSWSATISEQGGGNAAGVTYGYVTVVAAVGSGPGLRVTARVVGG